MRKINLIIIALVVIVCVASITAYVLTRSGSQLVVLSLSITPTNGGTLNHVLGDTEYLAGTTIYLEATASSGFLFKQWIVDEMEVHAESSFTLIMSQSHTAQAIFVKSATVTFNVLGIKDPLSSNVLTLDGVNYAVSALPKVFPFIPGENHTFCWESYLDISEGKRYFWTNTSGLSSDRGGTFTVLEEPALVIATYQRHFLLNGEVTPAFSGVITVTPQNTPLSELWVPENVTVEVAATPFENYRFDHFMLDNTLTVIENQTTIYMNIPHAITANFVPLATVTFSSDIKEEGTFGVVTVDAIEYSLENPVTFTWDVGTTHAFSFPSIVESVVFGKRFLLENTSSNSPIIVNASVEVLARYKIQYLLDVSSQQPSFGTTSPAPGAYWFDCRAAINITAIPLQGCRFIGWLVNGEPIMTVPEHDPTILTINVDQKYNITARFEQIPLVVTVMFSVTGAAGAPEISTLTVDETVYPFSNLSLTFVWDKNSIHTYSFMPALQFSGAGKRWILKRVLGPPSPFVANTDTIICAEYGVQYLLDVSINDQSLGTTDPVPSQYWCNENSLVTLNATANDYCDFESWVINGDLNLANPLELSINSATTVVAQFKYSAKRTRAYAIVAIPHVGVFAVDVAGMATIKQLDVPVVDHYILEASLQALYVGHNLPDRSLVRMDTTTHEVLQINFSDAWLINDLLLQGEKLYVLLINGADDTTWLQVLNATSLETLSICKINMTAVGYGNNLAFDGENFYLSTFDSLALTSFLLKLDENFTIMNQTVVSSSGAVFSIAFSTTSVFVRAEDMIALYTKDLDLTAANYEVKGYGTIYQNNEVISVAGNTVEGNPCIYQLDGNLQINQTIVLSTKQGTASHVGVVNGQFMVYFREFGVGVLICRISEETQDKLLFENTVDYFASDAVFQVMPTGAFEP